jgi:adenosylhomocysteine nucleosidase
MDEEIKMIKDHVVIKKEHKYNKYVDIFEAEYQGKPLVFARSGVGQIFASSLATVMIVDFKVTHVIFTGVAGGLKTHQQIGDVVIANYTINYDLDCTNFKMPSVPDHRRGEIPFLRLREYHCDARMVDIARAASTTAPTQVGVVATGSEFLTNERKKALSDVWAAVDDPECVEMEGAAVGQICHSFDVPFLIIRSISDTIHGDANVDFAKFSQHAADINFTVVKALIEQL